MSEAALDINLDGIPEALADRDQWVLWTYEERDGRFTKVPKQPGSGNASSDTPATWSDLDTVLNAYRNGQYDGIGFVLTDEDWFVFIDLDDCVEDGELTEPAQNICDGFDTFAEWSPSGTGVHIIGAGMKPGTDCKALDVPGMEEIEIYESGRYMTMTGQRIDGHPKAIKPCREAIIDVYEWAFRDDEPDRPEPTTSPERDLSETEIWDLIEQADDDKIQRLWKGDTSMHGHDHSRADSALCSKLYFYGADETQIDNLFRDSGLMRGKWDEQRGNQTYGDLTIQNAINEIDERHPAVTGDEGEGSSQPQHRSNGQASGDAPSSWGRVYQLYDQQEKGRGRVEAANQLIGDLFFATHRKSKHLYIWDSGEKVYAEDGEERVRTLLVHKLKDHFSQHEVSEILGMVRARTYRDSFGADGFIPVANGDLKVTADEVGLKEATPERGFRNRSSASWDPGADAPIFQTYLKDVVHTEEERDTLQEYAGYSLMYWGLPYHKALFLVGPQASGKSTLLKAIHEMLGKTTQLSPQQLVDERFGAIELEDSWANIASDIPSELLSNVGRFKEITAGDPIHAERKYEQGYSIEPTAKHFYSANQLPEIKIDDDAFFRRVLIVAFPKTIPRRERDPKLPERLNQELDGILRWAVEGLQRLLQNEDFTRDLKPEDTRRLWDEHASSIGQFKIRRLDVTGHSQDVVAKQDVYRAYTDFCMSNGLPTESQQKLTRVLKRDPRIGQAKRTPDGWDKQAKCYVGVKVPAEGNVAEPNDEPPF